jgi:putative nucleotidyltransferase with HDIG domain
MMAATSVLSVSNLAESMPAVASLESASLRNAVLATWCASLERSPYESLAHSPQAPHMPTRSLILHVNEVNQRALELLRVATDEYGLSADADVTLATAILHDVDKPMIYRWDGQDFTYADGRSLKDHGAVGAELCLEHGVPLEVAEMVRHHSAFASEGLPGTVEGTIVHYADFVSNDFAAILSGVETIHASTRPVPKIRGD